MSGIAAVIVKMMPEGPDSDLENIKELAKSKLEEDGAQNISFEIKEVAFGLKAIFVKFAWPEKKDTSLFEDKLADVEGVSSVDTEDYRRAFG
ncbi:MAG: elongation factor 1-beta [Nanoarchaeota archaeon]|nr:elongation factor 1-beta [Nanoarchaeota archaeon]MBU0976898.1 elongation factor 1-beta [Nanoarchaeota archaeon]